MLSCRQRLVRFSLAIVWLLAFLVSASNNINGPEKGADHNTGGTAITEKVLQLKAAALSSEIIDRLTKGKTLDTSTGSVADTVSATTEETALAEKVRQLKAAGLSDELIARMMKGKKTPAACGSDSADMTADASDVTVTVTATDNNNEEGREVPSTSAAATVIESTAAEADHIRKLKVAGFSDEMIIKIMKKWSSSTHSADATTSTAATVTGTATDSNGAEDGADHSTASVSATTEETALAEKVRQLKAAGVSDELIARMMKGKKTPAASASTSDSADSSTTLPDIISGDVEDIGGILNLDEVEVMEEGNVVVDKEYDEILSWEEMFETEELKLLLDEQFYRNGEEDLNMIIELDSERKVMSPHKEGVILEHHPQSVFVRVNTDQYEFITDSTPSEDTIDDLFLRLKEDNHTDISPTIILVEHPNGIVAAIFT